MRYLPNLRHLQYLLALYEHQHFGRAAEACFISQSTLSTAITHLEEQLNAKLLERSHKTFIFNTLGHEVVQLSQRILEQCLHLKEMANDYSHPMQGKLQVACIPTIAPFILSDLLSLTQQRYPELQLFLREETTDNALKALSSGDLDFVILALPYKTNDFHTKVLMRDRFQLILHKDWLDQSFHKDISFWPDESIFLLEHEHCLTRHTIEACKVHQKEKIHPFFATSLHTLVQMVNHKLGVTFLPELAIQNGLLNDTEVVTLSSNTNQAYRDIGIAWRKTSFQNQRVNLFSELISDLLITQKNK